MKKIIFSLTILLASYVAMAQSDAYVGGMKSLMGRLQGQQTAEAYQETGNGFLRIAGAETSEWLPKYYAAYCMIMQAMYTKDKQSVDAILDAADDLLADISKTVKSDEVMCLQAWSKSTRINVDPMSRGMKYGMESAKFLGQAQAMNPENPRVYFLQAQSAFYTPEQFGGGKKTALRLFQTALEKYEKFKPANELMPNWGKEVTVKMIEECQK